MDLYGMLFTSVLSVAVFSQHLSACLESTGPVIVSQPSHQAKNITQNEFGALSDMLSSLSWDLPECQEYKDEIPAPILPGPSMSYTPYLASTSQPDGSQLALCDKPKGEDKMTEKEWNKLDLMVVASCL